MQMRLSDTRIFIAAIVGVIAVHALTLVLMGRIPYCACGFGLWTNSGWSASTSQNLGDPYSFSHVLHGIIFYGVLRLVAPRLPQRWRLILAMLVEVAWEITENTPFIINRYRTATASLDYYGDSVLNSVGDVFSTILGFWLAARVPWKWTLAIVIVVELTMLSFLRDNLTLNVLMLLYPLEAVKQWQMGG